jgi:hypothetical protein
MPGEKKGQALLLLTLLAGCDNRDDGYRYIVQTPYKTYIASAWCPAYTNNCIEIRLVSGERVRICGSYSIRDSVMSHD